MMSFGSSLNPNAVVCSQCLAQFKDRTELEIHSLSSGHQSERNYANALMLNSRSSAEEMVGNISDNVGNVVGKLKGKIDSISSNISGNIPIKNVSDAFWTLSSTLTAKTSNNENEDYDEAAIIAELERIRAESKATCVLIFKEHLDEYLKNSPNSTYEEWINDLHPENIQSNDDGLIILDHRFYLEDSDHLNMWNHHFKVPSNRQVTQTLRNNNDQTSNSSSSGFVDDLLDFSFTSSSTKSSESFLPPSVDLLSSLQAQQDQFQQLFTMLSQQQQQPTTPTVGTAVTTTSTEQLSQHQQFQLHPGSSEHHQQPAAVLPHKQASELPRPLFQGLAVRPQTGNSVFNNVSSASPSQPNNKNDLVGYDAVSFSLGHTPSSSTQPSSLDFDLSSLQRNDHFSRNVKNHLNVSNATSDSIVSPTKAPLDLDEFDPFATSTRRKQEDAHHYR